MAPHPIYFRHGDASLHLVQMGARTYALSTLYSHHRERGDASEAMRKAMDYADRRGLTLRLIARPFGDTRGLSQTQLVTFYEKFGFVKDESRHPYPISMTRLPREKNKPPNESHDA